VIKADGAQGAQHDHLSLGEIDDGGGIEDDAEAQGDEGVNGAIGQSGKEVLEQRGEGWHQLSVVRSQLPVAKDMTPSC